MCWNTLLFCGGVVAPTDISGLKATLRLPVLCAARLLIRRGAFLRIGVPGTDFVTFRHGVFDWLL